MRKFLLIHFIFFSSQLLSQAQGLQKGFDKNEYVKLMHISARQLDTPWVNSKFPIPDGYQLSGNALAVLSSVKSVSSGQQITLLRNFVVDMGFDPKKDGSQVVSEPVTPPTPVQDRQKISIEGVDNSTVTSYMELLNANDFFL